ncbi:MAG TPA: patatin-like phospholipase family protein [Chryseolinea sp.]
MIKSRQRSRRKYLPLKLACALVFCAFLANAQTYKNLIFEGAGVRGIAFAGAVRELEDRQLLPQVEKVGGTSAGAIAALTVALGYRSTEIESIIYDTKVQRFKDGNLSVIGGVKRMKENFGWYRHQDFLKWLDAIIRAKTGNGNVTFRELHAQKFRDLYVTGTSLNHQKLIVFSHETYPDMKVKDAVCISMSIPLYFVSVCIDEKGAIIDRRKATGYYDIMADGGFAGNFPIALFDSTVTTTAETSRMFNPHTLGFRIDSPAQIDYDRAHRGLAPIDILRFRDYIHAFYTFTLENLNRSSLTTADWERTVSISCGNIGPKIRKLSLEEKSMLIVNGQHAVEAFLQ